MAKLINVSPVSESSYPVYSKLYSTLFMSLNRCLKWFRLLSLGDNYCVPEPLMCMYVCVCVCLCVCVCVCVCGDVCCDDVRSIERETDGKGRTLSFEERGTQSVTVVRFIL